MLKTTMLAQITNEMRNYRLDVLGLSEVRWEQSGRKTTTTGETLIYSCTPTGGSSGVGILISKNAEKCLVDWQPISDRIITARFKTRARHLTFIQVYAPTEQASPDEKEAFYRQLAETCLKIGRGDIKILMGDLNAKVGSNNQGWEMVMGRHGLGDMNENGELFAEFCLNNDFVIGGTLFRHRNIHKVTWVSPDRRTKNQIDHIAISSRWRSSLLDVRNRKGADVYSDHHLIVGQIRIKLATTIRKTVTAPRKINIAKLQDPVACTAFREQLRENLSQNDTNGSTEEKWNSVTATFQEASENILGFRPNGRKEWISDHTWNLIERRRDMKGRINTASSPELVQQYNLLDKQIAKSARSDKRKWVDDIADNAQQAANNGNSRELYRLTRKLSCKKYSSDHPLKDKDGNLLTMAEEQLDRWSEYFEDLLNRTPPSCTHSPSTPRATPRISDGPPSKNEIKGAIKRLKQGKAPGADSISSEMLKLDPDLIVETIHPLLNEVWRSETIPEKWKDGLIIKLPKKGDLSVCSNWRGITLLNTINKILSIVIHERISIALEPTLRKEQAGFRPGRSCIDHINTLRVIIEQSEELQTPLYLLFVDFERAFDTLDHERMWTILECYGIPTKVLNIVKGLYRDVSCRVVHNGRLGRQIKVKSGVKQGCILSPLLFTIILDWVMKKATKTPRGIQWTMSSRLEDLDFADDICMMTHRESDMRAKLNQLVHYAGQVGLKVNARKTKLMRLDPDSRGGTVQLCVGSTVIEEVEKFCYLGSIISKNSSSDDDIITRIQKARQAFGQLNAVWNSSQLSRNLKLKLFKTNVLPVMLYGSETWRVTARNTAKIQVFVNKCLRRIFKFRWTDMIQNKDLWIMARMDNLERTIRRRKWNWIGHTLRRPNYEIARQALDWNPQGTRKRGRPKQTWRRSIEEEARARKYTWKEVKALASNRVRWRGFCDALCS
jgi:hypothetical protein